MFNEQQKKAICHGKGAAMILAGPGTGKTTVITERIKWLIEQNIAREEELLVVTFTKAAAMEMQQRYEKKGNRNQCGITFGTFHSIFLRIIRESNPGYRGMEILTQDNQSRIIKEIVMRLGVDCTDIYEFTRNLSSEISKVNGNGQKIDTFVSGVCDRDTFIKIYNEYEKSLNAERKLDFDDMITKCHQLLKQDTDIRQYWQNKFRFIMIDEFQDINKMQYETVKYLVGSEENIFIVGDDDQSIYGFRGSDNQLMFDFEKEFHNVKVINLNTNYRSTKQIVEAAFKLVEHNDKRFVKHIQAHKGEGNHVQIREFESNILQYKYLAKKVAECIKNGIEPAQIAILVRNNGTIPIIRNFLGEQRINVSAKLKNNIYKSEVAKDILSYIKCSMHDMNMKLLDNKDFINIINKPYRSVGRHVIFENEGGMNELMKAYANSKEITQNLNDFMFHMKMIARLDPYSAINYIKYGVGYDAYLKEYAAIKNIQFSNLQNEFDKIWNDASGFKSLKEWINYMERQMNVESIMEIGRGNVNLLTMHASKGLEYRVVFIPDANQGVIPEARALREYNVEEERRIFFVAMTRASEQLHILYNDNVMGRKCQKSQFIQEIS